MGYSIYLIDKNKSITEELVNELIPLLPKRLAHVYNGAVHKQSWGWSLVTDLSINKNNTKNISYLVISGSFGISGKWALDMVVSFQQLLQRKGFIIEIYSSDFGFCNKKLYKWLGYDPKELVKEESF